MQLSLTLTPTGEFWLPTDNPAEVRAWITGVANTLLALPPEYHREFPVKHTFLNGMYTREMFIPSGSLLVGKIHKLPCVNIVSMGDISVATELGSARVKAGQTTVSPAGLRKIGYAHEDTMFINVFRTDETDLNKIEDAIAYRDDDDYLRSTLCQY